MAIIKIADGRFARYEELLMKRDTCSKEAEAYFMLYLREFGEQLTEVFKKKVDCIKVKKSITFCQTYVNRGEHVNYNELEEYLNIQMKEYNETLERLLEDNRLSKHIKEIPEDVALNVKKKYRRLAKLIHPDINPATSEIPALGELWNRIVIAYKTNSLKELEEAEIAVNNALRIHGLETIEIDVPDIEEKIKALEAEINRIIDTDPYRYKYLLEDEELVKEKHRLLDAELEEYTAYEQELKEILRTYLMNGVDIPWDTN